MRYLGWLFSLMAMAVPIPPQGGSAKWDGRFQNRSGVTVVENTGRPLYPAGILDLTKEAVFSSEGEVPGVDVDDKGRVFLLDRITAAITVFGPDGRRIMSFGRKGQGPGEAQMPLFVKGRGEELFVFDSLGRKMIILSKQGAFLRQMDSRARFKPVGIDSNGLYLGLVALAPAPIGGGELNQYDAEFHLVRSIFRVEPDYAQGEKKEMIIGKPRLCGALSAEDEVFWSYPDRYEIRVLDSTGRLVRIIQNRDPKPPMTSRDKAFYGNEYRDFPGTLKFLDAWPALEDLSLEPKGRLLVRTCARSDGPSSPAVYDIYDREGRHLARQPLAARIDGTSVWWGGKLYSLEESEEGFNRVVRYAVAWRH